MQGFLCQPRSVRDAGALSAGSKNSVRHGANCGGIDWLNTEFAFVKRVFRDP